MAFTYVAGRAKSFAAALSGVRVLLAESNSRIHGLATIVTLTLAVILELTRVEWCALVFAVALVWIAEGLNTALEKLADAAVPREHALVRKAKDVAAAAVLVSALAAAVIGALLFLPRLVALAR